MQEKLRIAITNLRLLALVAVTIILFAVTVLISVSMGGVVEPAIGVLFTRTDGSQCSPPCLFGVEWNAVTTSDQAKLIMRKHPLLKGLGEDYLSGGGQIIYGNNFFLNYWENSIILYRTNWVINGENPALDPFLSNILDKTTLQNVITMWGNPTYIQLDSNIVIAGGTVIEMPLIYLYYPDKRMIFIHKRSTEGMVSPNDPIFAIMLFSSAALPDPSHWNYGYPPMLPDPWHGYGPIILYPQVDAPMPTVGPDS